MLVPLVEEGWIDHPVTRDVLRIYLREALDDVFPGGCLPRLHPLSAHRATGHRTDLAGARAQTPEVIDSARATAFVVSQGIQNRIVATPTQPDATFECYATDSTEKFARLGSQFLGQPIPQVELLDLGG